MKILLIFFLEVGAIPQQSRNVRKLLMTAGTATPHLVLEEEISAKISGVEKNGGIEANG